MNKPREITYARMHTAIFAPEVGNIPADLSANSGPSNRAVKMTLEDNVVVCEFTRKDGQVTTMLIPLVNFTNLVVKKAAVETNSKA